MPRAKGPRRSVPLALAAGILAAGFASASAADAPTPAKMAALTPEDVRARATVIDDHLELETIISTERVFRSTRGLFGTAWNDNHLQAAINKRTGAVRFEVRQSVNYNGPFRNFGAVSYQTSTWPVTAPVMRVADNAALCAGFDVPAGCFEELTFEVKEAELREIGASYSPSAPAQWTFKFRADKGDDWRAGLMRAEVAGLLSAVDDHRRKLALTSGPELAAR